MYSMKESLLNFDESFLKETFQSLGEPGYRAAQVFDWVYRKKVASFAEMTNLPVCLRDFLDKHYQIDPLALLNYQESADGTLKFLFSLGDNEKIESVLIPMNQGLTLCLSTQVGCPLDCKFCLTGVMGYTRNLTAGEILGQVLFIQRWLQPKNRISNVVFMGMGEPLANYQNTIKAIRVMLSEKGLNLSNRKITVSTSGIVPGIKKLGQEDFTVNLAVSLHAPSNDLRTQLMPINRKYPLEMLLEACREYPLPKRRRITFEYVLLKGVNDRPHHAKELTKILKGFRCKINLLPFNEAPELPYERPSDAEVLQFQKILIEQGYSVFIRTSRGRDILAACGQLAVRSSDPGCSGFKLRPMSSATASAGFFPSKSMA